MMRSSKAEIIDKLDSTYYHVKVTNKSGFEIRKVKATNTRQAMERCFDSEYYTVVFSLHY